MAIAGFPLTSGFFSKDLILEKVYERFGAGAYGLLLGAALVTAFLQAMNISLLRST